ncbi:MULTISPECIES: nitroreductase family protein [unclassified Ensifer]|uniref:nitroreductase family protein n=1 Tax=unclassified Ensifer TaxID=2633371 RepID=UPI000813187B|nr:MULTISPECIES: nitroreductase family protein [unclassified Ensifer]OCP15752.1 NADH dehydrogenase [Ensifer sp. LC54]OCP26230.1 NADH dehydrogenase [Ensifer sp. LC384]
MTIEINSRIAGHSINPLFLERWSPRAYAGADISEAELFGILEAARWAPSAYNAQPWHFIYARRGSEHWDKLFGILNTFNQSWAKDASALIFVLSKTSLLPPGASEEVPSYTHSFDTGAAWGALALQAAYSGWQAHGMAGLDYDRARTDLGVPSDYRVEAAVAIGRIGDKAQLPEGLREREVPSPRKSLSEISSEGHFERS